MQPPPSAGNAGATNVFQAPQYPPAPQAGYGAAPSGAPSSFTSMMSVPSQSGGVLAQAAAAPAPPQQSAFKKFLPFILIFGAALVVLIIILIFFAMRKH